MYVITYVGIWLLENALANNRNDVDRVLLEQLCQSGSKIRKLICYCLE